MLLVSAVQKSELIVHTHISADTDICVYIYHICVYMYDIYVYIYVIYVYIYHMYMCVYIPRESEVAQSCPTLDDPMN